MNTMRNEMILRKGSIGKLLVSLSLPVILVMLVNVIYNMADVYFLGQTGDTLQVAAASLAGPLFGMASALNTLLGFGACTAASMALGKGDLRSIRQYSSFCLYASAILGIVLLLGVWTLTNPLVSLLGANEETACYTADYLRIFAIGAPFMIAGGSLGNLLRADGESKGAVISSLIGTGINIVLDPLFITGLGGGIRGAAWATVIGNICSFCCILAAVRRKKIFSLALRDFTWKKEISFKVLSLGTPMAAGTLLMSFSSTFANRLLVLYGNNAVAAHAVSGKAGMLVSMLIMGICMGVQPAVSYAYGQHNTRRMHQVVIGTTAVAVLTGVVLGGLFLIFRESFVRMFLDDEAILEMGKLMVVGGLVSAPISAVYQMCQVYLQSTGKVDYATFTALLQKGIVYIPVLYGMYALFGLNGLIFTGVVTDVIATLAGVLFCIRWSRDINAEARMQFPPTAIQANSWN